MSSNGLLIEILGSWNRGGGSNLQALFTLCSRLCRCAHGSGRRRHLAAHGQGSEEGAKEGGKEARRLPAGHPPAPRVLCAVPQGRKPAEGCCWGGSGQAQAGAAAVTVWVWSLRCPLAVGVSLCGVWLTSGLVPETEYNKPITTLFLS